MKKEMLKLDLLMWLLGILIIVYSCTNNPVPDVDKEFEKFMADTMEIDTAARTAELR